MVLVVRCEWCGRVRAAAGLVEGAGARKAQRALCQRQVQGTCYPRREETAQERRLREWEERVAAEGLPAWTRREAERLGRPKPAAPAAGTFDAVAEGEATAPARARRLAEAEAERLIAEANVQD